MTILLVEGNQRRKKNPEKKAYRPLSFAEVKQLPQYARVEFDYEDGSTRQVRITSIKSWKTRPNNLDVRWKYGLYAYGVNEYRDGVCSSGVVLLAEESQS